LSTGFLRFRHGSDLALNPPQVCEPGRPKQNASKDGGDYSFMHVSPVGAR
jgi:hypothetical protein